MNKVEPRFTLPGDEKHVQVMAYSEGIHCIPTVALLADSDALKLRKNSKFRLKVPNDEDVPKGAQQIADMLVSSPESNQEMPTTNAPEQFCEIYVASYLKGYRFCKFALYHGLLDLLSELPVKRHSELFYRFAWEHLMQQSVYDDGSETVHDAVMDEGVEAMKAIYKEYQRFRSETKEQITGRLIEGLMQEIEHRRQKPEVGDHIEGTTEDGYKVVADCVPDPGILKYDPKKGEPFVLAISIFDLDGKPLMERGKLVD